jgi:ribosomal protein S18 acetylase RimI-like enzyme
MGAQPIGEDCAVSWVIEPAYQQVIEFCTREPVERVFLEDVARRGIGRFSAVARGDGSLDALCHVGANLVPSGVGCGAFAEAAQRGQSRMIIGEERAVGDLWAAAGSGMPAPREDRPGQPVFVIDEPPAPGETGLRPATLDDVERLVPACSAAHREELGIDPLERDADGFRWRTRAQVEEGRSWLWLEDDVILFKAEASAWTPSAVQVQQVWADPEVRGRGYGQRGMRDLCRLLLATAPVVTLFVRADNPTAIHVYESVGMRRALTYRSVLLA